MNDQVATFSSRTEANIAKGLLQANNITSYIQADDAGNMYPQLGTTAGVKLYVANRDAQKARKLLGR